MELIFKIIKWWWDLGVGVLNHKNMAFIAKLGWRFFNDNL